MHCVLHADLAATLSDHGPAILYRTDSVPPEAITKYWASSRNRFELWHQTMARYRAAEQSGLSALMRQWWTKHIVVLEEILVTEMLTRVVASLAMAMEQSRTECEISPVTHAIYLSHLEARNRVQQLMLFGRGSSVQDAVRLNRLRQGIERWTDVLIGRIAANAPCVIDYAVDSKRAAIYASEMRQHGNGPERSTACWLLNASMHDMLSRRTSKAIALPQANRSVSNSIMLMLRPDLFDSVGSLKSLWLHRLQIDSDRADRVLDELAAPNLDDARTADGYEVTHDPSFQRWYLQ